MDVLQKLLDFLVKLMDCSVDLDPGAPHDPDADGKPLLRAKQKPTTAYTV